MIIPLSLNQKNADFAEQREGERIFIKQFSDKIYLMRNLQINTQRVERDTEAMVYTKFGTAKLQDESIQFLYRLRVANYIQTIEQEEGIYRSPMK